MLKFVGGTCLGLFRALNVSSAMAQSSLSAGQGHCRSAVRDYLIERGVDAQDIQSIDLRAERKDLTAVESTGRQRRVGWEAWARLQSCDNTLSFKLDEFCRVLSRDVPKDCPIKELESDKESEGGLLDIFKSKDSD